MNVKVCKKRHASTGSGANLVEHLKFSNFYPLFNFGKWSRAV